MRRLHFIGQGGSSWRDPRNWSIEKDGPPLRHLHARGGDIFVVGHAGTDHGRLDLRGLPYASVEVNGYRGDLTLPDGSRAIFPRRRSRRSRIRAWIHGRRGVHPAIPRAVDKAMGRAGGWQQAVRDGLATLVFTHRGWAVVPLLGGGAFANVRTGAVASNGGGTGAVSPTYSGGLTNAGNLLVGLAAATVGASGGTWTVDNSQAGWALAVPDTSRTNVQSAIFYRANCGANESPPTFKYSNSATVQAVLMEFSGALKASPLDQTGHDNAIGGTTTTANGTAVCASTDVASGQLIVTADAFSFGSNTTLPTSSDTYNNGATPTGNINNDSTSTRNHYRFAYGITTGHSSADSDTYDNAKVGGGSVASVCIASFKVAINVTQTASEPYEALKGIAATGSEPYEALGGVAATASDPYEAGQGVTGTNAEPFESLGGIQQTGSDPFESLAGIAATASLPFEALLALAIAGSLPYETLLGVQQAGSSSPFESLGGISSSASDPYETAAGIAATSGELPFEAPAGLTINTDLAYEALAALATSGALPFETVGGVASSSGLPFETLLGVASESGLDYEALAGIAAEGTLPFEALGGVSAEAAMPFESLSAVAAAIAALPYEALAGLVAAAEAPFESLGGVSAVAEAPFESLAALVALAELPVESLAGLAAVVVLPYETIALITVQALVVLPYETRASRIGVTDGFTIPVAASSGRSIAAIAAGGELLVIAIADGDVRAVAESSGVERPAAKTDGKVIP